MRSSVFTMEINPQGSRSCLEVFDLTAKSKTSDLTITKRLPDEQNAAMVVIVKS
jgi:hypothetical protein